MTRAELEQRTRDFFAKWDLHAVDFDGAYGFQCMDLAEQFNKEVLGGPRLGGNAVDNVGRHNDFYDWIPNTVSAIPATGDVVVWNSGIGQYGHISVAKGADGANVNWFDSLDQNWPDSGGHGVAHFVRHNYKSVAGWMRPITHEPAPPVEQPPVVTPAPVTPPEPPKPVDPTPPSEIPSTPPTEAENASQGVGIIRALLRALLRWLGVSNA